MRAIKRGATYDGLLGIIGADPTKPLLFRMRELDLLFKMVTRCRQPAEQYYYSLNKVSYEFN